ncbi:MAG: chlorophyll synthase ChlG [Pseudomonadota bacterium]
MRDALATLDARRAPSPAAVAELLKPVTWFAPMWAFLCGAVSSGAAFDWRWALAPVGMALAGPFVCGASQAANDWFDRHVDAINEPNRPIPSGRVPGRWGLWIAVLWSAASLALGAVLGVWAFGATVAALAIGWAYSAPPVRLKADGWAGAAACGLTYEGLAWFTGAAVLLNAAPPPEALALAVLYSVGAHGIMTLNDFKALKGDAEMGVRSLPVALGPERAAKIACVVMALPQLAVVGLLVSWERPIHAAAVAALVAAQLVLMRTLLKDPAAKAPWYNATGVSLFVLGMMASAVAARSVVLGGGA